MCNLNSNLGPGLQLSQVVNICSLQVNFLPFTFLFTLLSVARCNRNDGTLCRHPSFSARSPSSLLQKWCARMCTHAWTAFTEPATPAPQTKAFLGVKPLQPAQGLISQLLLATLGTCQFIRVLTNLWPQALLRLQWHPQCKLQNENSTIVRLTAGDTAEVTA